MRDILFRAKESDTNQWVYGSLLRFKGCTIFDENFGRLHPVREETVCEYTGMRDKNGIRIFEYDSVELFGATYTVVYSEGSFNLSGSEGQIVGLGKFAARVAVIGNILDC